MIDCLLVFVMRQNGVCYAVQCCVVLCCAVLCCIMLCCAVLCYAVLRCVSPLSGSTVCGGPHTCC